MLDIVSGHVPPPAGALPPTRWGTEEAIGELFGSRVTELSFTTAAITQRLPSPELFADFFLQNYGPTLKAAERLTDEGRRVLRDDLVALAAEFNRANDGTLVSDWEYLVTVAAKG